MASFGKGEGWGSPQLDIYGIIGRKRVWQGMSLCPDEFVFLSDETVNLFFRAKDQATVCLLLVAAVSLVGLRYLVISDFRLNDKQAAIEFDQAASREYHFELDVNSAEWNQLTLLPGIGERLAHRIVEFRNVQGSIDNVDQLIAVDGIGPKKLASIRPYLYASFKDPVLATRNKD